MLIVFDNVSCLPNLCHTIFGSLSSVPASYFTSFQFDWVLSFLLTFVNHPLFFLRISSLLHPFYCFHFWNFLDINWVYSLLKLLYYRLILLLLVFHGHLPSYLDHRLEYVEDQWVREYYSGLRKSFALFLFSFLFACFGFKFVCFCYL